ncbi:MAG: hypothetical protein GXO68_00150 [Crenarchaeota archaeon]|nr:hypothetical protein [Thermoproteota archaeon]
MKCWTWPPPRRDKTLYLIIASSIMSVEETLELKTMKAGAIARIASIYRVNRVVVYRDKWSTSKDHRILRLVLEYALTPPHLRKRLIPLRPELRAVGYLPPLRLPGHDLPDKPVKGLVMEGIVESCNNRECRVYLGKYGVGRLPAGEYRVGQRVIVEIIDPETLQLRDASDTNIYLGFKVDATDNLDRYLRRLRKRGFLIVGTSRKGDCISPDHLDKIATHDKIALVFGGPRGDVRKDADPKLYHMVVNTIPFQGTRTVRSEEAISATLAIINAYEGIKRLYNL